MGSARVLQGLSKRVASPGTTAAAGYGPIGPASLPNRRRPVDVPAWPHLKIATHRASSQVESAEIDECTAQYRGPSRGGRRCSIVRCRVLLCPCL